MLKQEVDIRRSLAYQNIAQWAHKDINGETISTSDDMELFFQKTVLRKFGYPDTEKARQAYLNYCHKLYDQGDPKVLALNAPHLAHNPYNDSDQSSKEIRPDLLDRNGKLIDLPDNGVTHYM